VTIFLTIVIYKLLDYFIVLYFLLFLGSNTYRSEPFAGMDFYFGIWVNWVHIAFMVVFSNSIIWSFCNYFEY